MRATLWLSILSGVYRFHLLFFFSSASQACAAHDCLFSKPKHKFSADLSPLAEGDSSVHSSHSFMYSKTFPPHLSSLSLLNKHASGHWSALVRPTRWHLCKTNEFIPLQSPRVSQRVRFSIPCGLVFSRVKKRKNEKMQVLFPSSALMLFLTLLCHAFSLDYDNTSPVQLNYSSFLQVNKPICKNTLVPVHQSTCSSITEAKALPVLLLIQPGFHAMGMFTPIWAISFTVKSGMKIFLSIDELSRACNFKTRTFVPNC